MKEFLGTLLAIIVVLLVLCGFGFLIQGEDFFIYQWLAPKYAATQRQVFENSKAYREGTTQELDNMRLSYLHSTSAEEKAALANVILHRASNVPEDAMSTELRSFIYDLRGNASGVPPAKPVVWPSPPIKSTPKPDVLNQGQL